MMSWGNCWGTCETKRLRWASILVWFILPAAFWGTLAAAFIGLRKVPQNGPDKAACHTRRDCHYPLRGLVW